MADTLGRKHRLEQQQEQQFARNQIGPFGARGATHNNDEPLGAGERLTTLTKNHGSRRNERMATVGDDNDDGGGLSVFRVVEVGTNTCHKREEFPLTSRKQHKQQQQQLEGKMLQGNQQQLRIETSSSGGRRANFKGDSNAVRNGGGQIERRNENDFDRREEEDADYNHHHHRRREHSIYDGSLSRPSRRIRSHHPERQHSIHRQHHATNSDNHYQSRSLSASNGSSTTKSIGGSSSSGFSSSNGSYSSSIQEQQQQQQQQHHQQQHQHQHQHRKQPIYKDDCSTRVGNSCKQQDRRLQSHGQARRSKLIDDLDRLLMPPREPTEYHDSMSRRPIGGKSNNYKSNEGRGRRSSLVSPTESHISTATTSSHRRLSADASHQMAPNYIANDFDYSTLCRDEFSSFIPIEPPSDQPERSVRVVAATATAAATTDLIGSARGPMLVGVHEYEPSDIRPALTRHDNTTINGGFSDEDTSLSGADEPQSDDIDPYLAFGPIQCGGDGDVDVVDNVYEEIPGPSSILSSPIGNRVSSPPIISQSDESSLHESPSCSPIVCQNYSPETFASDSDEINSYNNDDFSDKSLVASAAGDDDDAIVYNRPHSNVAQTHKSDGLSRMLDIYVERMNTLIRLAQGDKSISIQEAFRMDDDHNEGLLFEVRAEHRTPVALVPLSDNRENSIRIIQEVEYEDEPTAAAADQRIGVHGDEDSLKRTIITRLQAPIHDRPLKSILESIQISPELSWSRRNPDEQPHYDCDISALVSGTKRKQATNIRSLERSLIGGLGLVADNDAGDNPDRFVAIIREHMKEFIENYHTYQMELSRETSFGDGSWHENWLFASKRLKTQIEPGGAKFQEVSSAKRARFSGANNQPAEPKWRQEDQENETAYDGSDLIKYSTLILAKCKPVRLTLVSNDSSDGNHYHRHHHKSEQQHNHSQSRSDITSHIESLYEAQLERVSELELVAIESSRQTDVCRLLLRDTDDEDDGDCGDGDTMDSNNNNKKTRPAASAQSNRSLLVSYDNTSLAPALNHANKFYFTASGYLFQTSLIKFPIDNVELRAKLERKILNKLISSIDEQSHNQPATASNASDRLIIRQKTSERVRFVISLPNIELINRLPVIQFCAKISGSLPIRVRWFRRLPARSDEDRRRQQQPQYEELSDISVAKRKNLNIRSVADRHSRWPIELQASYDYEYQTQSASWFRFRRIKDEIVFEIREPSLDTDYNRMYKCSIENACSRKECKFELTTKRVVNSFPSNCDRSREPPAARSRKVAAKLAAPAENENDGRHALLRTWSQRTLNKPQPSEPKVPTDTEHQRQQINYDARLLAGSGGRQATVGRLSALSMSEDKFGKNFPYHPENLLKRLEENKFSIPAKRKLVTAVSPSSTRMNDCHLTSGELSESTELAWSNSKVLFGDEEVVEPYYPKQLQPPRDQLASANNKSGPNSAHADPTNLDSHRRPLVNGGNCNKENFDRRHGQEATAGHRDAEKVQVAQPDRPRAVINLQPLSRIADLVDDSAGRLEAMQQVDDSRPEPQTSEFIADEPPAKDIVQEVQMQQQQQPKPRLRLSQTGNSSSKEQEIFRSNERVQSHSFIGQTNNWAAATTREVGQQSGASGAALLGAGQPSSNNCDRFNGGRDPNRRYHQQASEVKLTSGDDHDDEANQLRKDGEEIPPMNSHQKSSSNVKSLISRFSSA